MKNLLIAFVACFLHIAAIAQSKIEKDLQGTWKMTEMNMGGIFVNATTKEVKLSKEVESKITPEMRKSFNANKQVVLDKIAKSRVSFAGKKVNYSIDGVEKAGTYTVKPQGDAYILTVTGTDGSQGTMQLAIKEGKLRIVNNDDKGKAEMIFTKITVK